MSENLHETTAIVSALAFAVGTQSLVDFEFDFTGAPLLDETSGTALISLAETVETLFRGYPSVVQLQVFSRSRTSQASIFALDRRGDS